MRRNPQSRPWLFQTAGWLQLGLLGLLCWFAVDAAAHRGLHSDGREPHHHCAVTLLVQGKLDSAPPPCVAVENPIQFNLIARPSLSEAALSSVPHLLPFACGPPCA